MRWVLVLIVSAVAACGGGPASPQPQPQLSEQDLFGGVPALPTHTFYDDRLAACPTGAEIASVSDVEIVWGVNMQTGDLACHANAGSADLTRPQEEVIHALLLMKALRFDHPLPWTDKALYDWWKSVTRRAVFAAVDGVSHCCGDGAEITIFMGTARPALTFIGVETLAGVLVHEARHIDAGPHNCGTKDSRVSDLKAFGVHNLFFTWLGSYSDPALIPIEYRPYAMWQACTQRNSAFCNEPQMSCRQ